MTRQRQDKLIWVLGRHAQLIKNKGNMSKSDRVLLNAIRWIKTLIENQIVLNDEYKMLKSYDKILFEENKTERK